MDGAHEYFFFHQSQSFGRYQRCRAVGAHATGIGTGISVVSPFVVLRGRQSENRVSVRNGQHTHLRTVQTLFDDYLFPRTTELTLPQDQVDGRQRLGSLPAYKCPFSSRQSVRFDNQWHVFVFGGIAITHEFFRAICISKNVVIGGRYVSMAQQILTENFAPLQLGSVSSGPEDSKSRLGHGIGDPFDQRQLGTDHSQIDVVFARKLDQSFEIRGWDIHVFRIIGGSAVTGGHENSLNARTLCNLPGQRVFASTTANDKHVHSRQS